MQEKIVSKIEALFKRIETQVLLARDLFTRMKLDMLDDQLLGEHS